MKNRVIALILALVMVFDMGTVAFATGGMVDIPAEEEVIPAEGEFEGEDSVNEEGHSEEFPAKDIVISSEGEVLPVADPTLVSVAVTRLPDKLEYLCTDTAVDPTGGVLTITFSDDSTQDVELLEEYVSELDGTVGEVSVAVTYEGMTDSFTVTVAHSFDEGVVTVEPTATTEGEMTYTCENCGSEQTAEIPMAVSEEISGTCGSNLTWVLDKDGVLTISGTGKMWTYTYYVGSSRFVNTPWWEYRDDIQSITINSGVTSIGEYAFAYCGALERMIIPEGVLNIGSNAFYSCELLRNVYYGGTSEEWNEIEIGSNNSWLIWSKKHLESIGSRILWEYADGVLTISGSGMMDDYRTHKDQPWYEFSTEIKEIEIRPGVTDIGDGAFCGCSSLKSITIPEGVTSIGNDAFYGCTSLESIIIPEGVTGIDSYAFYGCSALEGVTILEGVTSIGNDAFYGCTSLESITIPDSVTSIGSSAFYGCNRLYNVHYSGTIAEWNVISIGSSNYQLTGAAKHYECSGCAVNWDYTDSVLTISGSGVMDSYNPDYLDSRPWHEYAGEVKKIIIQSGVTGIGEYAFYDCTSLESITISAGVASIGGNAFRGCVSLESVIISEGVTSIGYESFQGCENLTSITIPKSIVSIGDWAVYDCDRLSNVYYGGTREKWQTVQVGEWNYGLTNAKLHYESTGSSMAWEYDNGLLTISGNGMMDGYKYDYLEARPWHRNAGKIKEIVILPGVTDISGYAFYGCDALEKITIPETVTNIEEYAFYGCLSLTGVDMPNSVTGIGECAFYGCTTLASINIPDGVTVVGDSAFASCTALKIATIPASITDMGSHVFTDCGSLADVTLAEDIADMGIGTFRYCRSLAMIDIPKGVANIGESVFYGCSSLASITIPENVVNIDERAFGSCRSLRSVSIPVSVTDIGESAFSGCQGLKYVFYAGTEDQWDDMGIRSGNTCLTNANVYFGSVGCVVSIDGADSMVANSKMNIVANLTPENIPGVAVEWSLAEGDEAFTTLTSSWDAATSTATATITASAVSEVQEITVIASAVGAKNATAEHKITIIPAVDSVRIADENGTDVTGGTVNVNLNEQTELTFTAAAVPVGAEGSIVWTSGDAKGTYGSYMDNGDGTVSVSLIPTAKAGTITLTATEAVSKKKATVKITTTSLTTELTMDTTEGANEGVTTEASSGEITAEEKAAALTGGQSKVLSLAVGGNPSKATVKWSIPEEYAPYATIKAGAVKNGIATATVKANAVSAPVQIKVVAEAADNAEAAIEMWLWIVPATTGVSITNIDGRVITGNTVYFDLNDKNANNPVFDAFTLPAGSKDGIEWMSSDKTESVGSIVSRGDGSIAFVPVEGVTAGKTVTLTATANDGSKKVAKVMVKVVNLAHEVSIQNAPEELKGGKSVTLKTDVQNNKAFTDRTVEWTLDGVGSSYATITSAGKLTAKAFAGDPVDIQVTAVVKATGVKSKPVTITLMPNLKTSMTVMMDGENVNGTTPKVDVRKGEIILTADVVGLDDKSVTWGPTKETGAAYFTDASSGVLILNKEGSVSVTATGSDGKTKATVKLTVVTPVEKLEISGNSVMTGGTKQTLTVNFTDANDNPMKPTNSKVTWEIVEGEEYGSVKNGVLTAAKVTEEHAITVVAIANDNGNESEHFTVNIKPAASNIMLYVEENGTERSLTGTTETIDVGSEAQPSIHLMTKCYPYYEGQPDVTWKSSSAAIATVDENGMVEVQWDVKKGCWKTGKVTITATAADGSKKSAKVTLNLVQLMDSIEMPDTMGVAGGKNVTIKATPDALATNKKLVWSMTGDTAWATLSNGKITAKKVTSPKTVIVTAAAADGGGTSASCTVTIYPITTAVRIFSDGENVTGKTVDFADGMILTLRNTPYSAYRSWKAKSSNAAILAAVDNETGTLTLTKDSAKTGKANTKVTVTAADGSGKSAKVTVVTK